MPVPTLLQRLEAAHTRLNLIAGAAHRAAVPLAPLAYRPLRAPGFRQPPIAYASDDDGWTPLLPGTLWGAWQTHFALRGSFHIPADWDIPPTANTVIGLHLPLGEARDFEHPEALVVIDGQPLAGIDVHHPIIILPQALHDHAEHLLTMTGWTGLGGPDPAVLRLGQPALVIIDREVEGFVRQGRAALNAIRALDDLNPAKWDLLAALEAGLRALDLRHPLENSPGAPFRDSLPAGLAAFNAGLAAATPPHPLTVHSIGHAHIDTAWLWTTAETRGKVERTFHTALHLLSQYPDYVFAQSQPQLYDWFRAAHPESFARIQDRVRAGQWEPIGGMWIEADCNITGAESLIRQFVLGRAFFDEHFGPGAMTPILWLPDAFGFPASLPQIAALAGMQGFFTIKLRWNEVNEFPYDTFWWRGLDGTRLLAHMSTIPYNGSASDWATYNADPSPSSALYGWARQLDKHQRDVLMSYGWGDGGGGPTREMLDMIGTLAAFPGVPQHRFATVRAFYDHLRARYGAALPTWDGELYLETHQGTLSSQTRIKQANHRAEVLLHDVEFAAACASLLDPAYQYPHADLRAAWQTVCLHQFHDILPGSSIGAVYDDAEDTFATLFDRLTMLRSAAVTALAGQFSGGRITVNTVHARRIDPIPLPPLTITPLTAASQPAAEFVIAPGRLDSPSLRVSLNAAGDIVSLYDKAADRELLPEGVFANRLIAYEDRPARFDAWNVEPPALLPVLAESIPSDAVTQVTLSDGRAALRQSRRILNSTINQTISFSADGRALEFDLVIDWHEANALLKVHFPLDIRARAARCGIQWGHVERPTHTSTSWDAARYEVAHHGWIDVSEAGYGVSLIDAGIYGAAVADNVLSLTLVKRGRWPDADGDSGERHLRYALRPHHDGAITGTVTAALAFAHPALVGTAAATGSRDTAWSPLTMTPEDGAIVQTIKRSDDDQAIIIRLYEPSGTRQTVTIGFGFPVAAVERADVYETPLSGIAVTENAATLTLQPFEIVTVRVTPSR